MNPKFDIFQSEKNSQYYFCLRAENNKIVLASEGYTTKQNCRNGVDSVKKNAPHDLNYERRTATNGQFYFNLRSRQNSQVIGTSETYVSRQGREDGISSVKRCAPIAEIRDLTKDFAGA